MKTLNEDDSALVWIGSFRYYLGRMTISVNSFCELLKTEWDNIPLPAQGVILRDLKEAIEADDRDRLRGSEHKRLGEDVDRSTWLNVMKSIGCGDYGENKK